jgi:hypothetical protein
MSDRSPTKEEIAAREFADQTDEAAGDSPPKPLGDAIPTTAASFVSDDTDRPIADNKAEIPPPLQATPQGAPVPETQVKRGRGRPKGGGKANPGPGKQVPPSGAKAAPSFADLGVNVGTNAGPVMPPPRNYFNEATELFVPGSFFLSKMLGPHWGIEIDQEKHCISFTEEQKQYLTGIARWLEYEQFPPMSPRLGFFIQSIAYVAPRVKTEPTPERLKIGYLRITGWFRRLFSGKTRQEKEREKRKREKEADIDNL